MNNSYYTSTASTGNYKSVWDNLKIEEDKEDIKTELKKIAKEQEEDKEKHLPIFNPKDLDI